MKIDLTKKQYETLMKMVYLGNWLVNSAKSEPEKEFEDLEQMILSRAKDFGLETHAGFDEEAKAYYPTEAFEEETGVVDIIGEYNMYTVWEELVLALSKRDLAAEYGKEKVDEMADEELMEKEYPFILKYEEEFRENGFENLVISKKV
jgi:hypothetical protein